MDRTAKLTKVRVRVLAVCTLVALVLLIWALLPKKLATVGSYVITAQDVAYREKVAKIFYPTEKRKVGFYQLLKAFTYAEILKQNGFDLEKGILATEEHRINSNTRDAVRLAQIKSIFGSDHKAYIKDFVLPVYVERVIYFEFFLRSPRIHEPYRDKAVAFFREVHDRPDEFLSIAKKEGHSVERAFVSKDAGIRWESFDRADERNAAEGSKLIDLSQSAQAQKAIAQQQSAFEASEMSEAQRWLRDVVKATPRGQLFKNVVDRGENWLVVRNMGFNKAKKAYELHAAVFPKARYNEWLERESAKVPVRIFDHQSRVEVGLVEKLKH